MSETGRVLLALFRWDLRREIRNLAGLANMSLFALLVLFVAHLGVGPDRAAIAAAGPVVFWIAVLFAGTVGLSQTAAAEREGNTLGAIVTAPIDLGLFYLARVASTWLYVMIMEVVALGAYSILFNFTPWKRLGQGWPLLVLEALRSLGIFFSVMGLFTLAYVACGVVLACMTTSLRGGGEVLLRILLFPLMIPLIWVTLGVSETLFGAPIAGGALGPPVKLSHYYAIGLAFDAIYVTSGYLLFPKVVRE